MENSPLIPNESFSKLAEETMLEQTVSALKKNGFLVEVTDSKEQAKELSLSYISEGSTVFTSTSKTLENTGIAAEINEGGKYDSVRTRMAQENLDAREKAILPYTTEFVLGSVHAITSDGRVMVASGSGSQIPIYGYGAKSVIWVVSTKKLVRDLVEGFKRIYEYSYPLEDQRAREAYGSPSTVSQIFIMNKPATDRVRIILVKEDLGY